MLQAFDHAHVSATNAKQNAHFSLPSGLLELGCLRWIAIRRMIPGVPEELLRQVQEYLAVSTVILSCPDGSRYWWVGRYTVDKRLGLSAGAPMCRRGRAILYRWRAREDTRLRAAGARSRACRTEAEEGEEEWRIADEDFVHLIVRNTPHPSKLCLAGPLRSDKWLEVTRELREVREVTVTFE